MNPTLNNPSKFRQAWYSPAFSTLLENRLEGIVIVGVGVLLVGLHVLGLPGWVCPFKAVFGIPCPGCGLTAALDELLHGRLLTSLQTHAFAPVFLAAFLVLLVSVLLPKRLHDRFAAVFSGLERRTGLTAWVLSGLMLYWVIRLIGLV